MAHINFIREMYFEKGMNYADISRATGHDVKTIKKYLEKNDFNYPPPKEKKKRPSKLDPYKGDIDEWLENDQNERKKQRHTALVVHKRLGKIYGSSFQCSYRLVAEYVALKKKELYKGDKDFFLPLEHIPGEAQVDFGEADFIENGVRYHGHYLNLSFPYSNGGYLQLFKGENQECLFEGLKNIFNHINGVPNRMWFDNMSTVVKKILRNGQREFTEAFLRFKNHYGFTAALCNPDSGHEKGHVETKVGYHRRNLLVPVPQIEDLQAFNRQLLLQCDEDMDRPHYLKASLIGELFIADREKLLTLPAVEFDEGKLVVVKTDSYAKFTLNKGLHRYSTAPKYASKELHVRLTAHKVIILDENYREIIRHGRLYGQEPQESMDWLPYLTQLSRRPAALKYTGIYSMLPDPIQSFLDCASYQEKKEALKLLAELSLRTNFEKAVQALETAVDYGVRDTDSVLAVFSRQNSETLDLEPYIPPASVPKMPSLTPQVEHYDHLFGKRGSGH